MNRQAYQQFLDRNQLPASYLAVAERWFNPLISELANEASTRQQALVIGINGSQGSGKSTLADYICNQFDAQYQQSAISLSLDDFYLRKSERAELAESVHPLFATRGVPGTHDMQLATEVLNRLRRVDAGEVEVPRFDKAHDDRFPKAEWDRVNTPLALIVLEGWCIGVPAQSDQQLIEPLNALERLEDGDGRWRRAVNQAVATDYLNAFSCLDALIILQAPSFESVYQWRLEQEKKLAAKLQLTLGAEKSELMDEQQLERFLQFYQRLTEHGLTTIPAIADHVFQLDAQREIIAYHKS